MSEYPFQEDKTTDPSSAGDIPEPKFEATQYDPPSLAEGMRRNGLAWSAGIVFFGAIGFMLFLGWLADLLIGSSPWGIVAGIVLGSIIGFVQFFRISSQIFNGDKKGASIHPLFPDDDEDK